MKDPRYIYLIPGRQQVVNCLRCGKNIDMPPCLPKNPVVIYCECGDYVVIARDPRKEFRKRVALPGTCEVLAEKRSYPITIENISFSGVCFRSSVIRKLKLNDHVRVTFELPDHRKSVIDRVAVIKYLGNSRAGAQWVSSKHYDKALTIFLTS